jgi:hypothetical protein
VLFFGRTDEAGPPAEAELHPSPTGQEA